VIAWAVSAWAAVAWGAGLSGEIDHRPWQAVSAIAVGNPEQPGMLAVAFSDHPMSCDAGPSDGDRVLTVAFPPRVDAHPAPHAVVASPKRKIFQLGLVEGALVVLPDQAGQTGSVQVLFAGQDTLISGEMTFTLCEVVAPLPAPTSDFPVREVETVSPPLSVRVGVPAEWSLGEDFFGNPEWTASDRRTRFGVGATCAGACDPNQWEALARGWLASRVGGDPAALGEALEIVQNAPSAPGIWVSHYILRGPQTERRRTLDVLRYGPDWPAMAVCHLETDPDQEALALQALAVCQQLERRP
jgi:hypothetical protein